MKLAPSRGVVEFTSLIKASANIIEMLEWLNALDKYRNSRLFNHGLGFGRWKIEFVTQLKLS